MGSSDLKSEEAHLFWKDTQKYWLETALGSRNARTHALEPRQPGSEPTPHTPPLNYTAHTHTHTRNHNHNHVWRDVRCGDKTPGLKS